VLLVSPFFYPEPISAGKYNTYLAKALVRQGFSVEILTFHPFYPEWQTRKTKVCLNDIKIIRGGSFLQYPKSMILRRMILEIGFAYHAVRKTLSRRADDIILPIFPPILFFPFLNAILPKTTKKIGIVHDLLSVMGELAKGFPKKLVMKVTRILEKKAFEACDKLIFVSESMANKAIEEYSLNPKKISISYPFVTLEMKEATNALENLFPPSYKHIVYAGAVGEKQNPISLLRVFQGIVQLRADVCCHIFSRGPLFDELVKRAEDNSHNFERVFFHDLVADENLLELYLKSNIQIITQKQGSSEGAIPSKLPNIISAGVPIFVISDEGSELSLIVEASGIGRSTQWDFDDLVPRLNEFLEISCLQTHQGRQQMVSSFVADNFRIEHLLSEIIH